MYKITINNLRKVHAIQEEFTAYFPQLKIEFYEKSNLAHGGRTEHFVKGSNMKIEHCRVHKNDGDVYFNEEMNVGELKSTFSNSFGLSIEIFHKSGKNEWSHFPVQDDEILKDINFKMNIVF